MGNLVLRALDAKDVSAVHELADTRYLEQLHPDDRSLVSPTGMRRRLARRYRSDVIAANDSLAIFRSDTLTAFALYGDGQNPVSGEKERHLLDLVDASDDGRELRIVMEAVLETARTQGVDLVQVEVSAHGENAEQVRRVLAELGLINRHLILRRTVGPSSYGPGRFELTPAEYKGFALDCLVQGIANTLVEADTAVLQRISKFVSRRFGRLQTPRRFSAVAFDAAGSPRAHALVELVPSVLCDAVEASLVDIFVLPEWKGMGWSIRLWRYVERLLHDRGIERAEGTLFLHGAPIPRELLAGLEEHGWWIDRYVMICRPKR